MKISYAFVVTLIISLAFTNALQAQLSEPTASIQNDSSGKIHYKFRTWEKNGNELTSGTIKAGKTQNLDVREIHLPIFLEISAGGVKKIYTFTRSKTIFVTWDGQKISTQGEKGKSKQGYSLERNVAENDISQAH